MFAIYNWRGYPGIGDLARLLRTYPDEFLYFPIIPVAVQRALAVPLSKLGSAAGKPSGASGSHA